MDIGSLGSVGQGVILKTFPPLVGTFYFLKKNSKNIFSL